ncbi:protein SUPPRESSOR OF QUENCHING 1, chloroplastic-like [Pistacia vera]|uniref:protein SUPPRESSOR OF QUENCHING 1, chloroplastic-like n=1 Tax=Pistacia vera TaxID=55513 RepID=UPI0012635854|nr:protein SUPPRESSOR OF QUENCHING 1, chloroplastic-like [Pistacia vera]
MMHILLLNSPWDVCFELVNEKVYIAMAGQHQIWEHNTLDGVTKAFSGDGYERNLNGSRLIRKKKVKGDKEKFDQFEVQAELG